MNIQNLVLHLAHIIHAPISVYNSGNELLYCCGKEEQSVFMYDETLKNYCFESKVKDYPVIKIDEEAVVCGIVYDGKDTYIIGPCCVKKNVTEISKKIKEKYKIKAEKPLKLHYVPFRIFAEVLILLYETVNDKPMDWETIGLKNLELEHLQKELSQKKNEVFYSYQERVAEHNPYSQEIREQDAIKKGNLSALYDSFAETYAGEIGVLSQDAMRQAKNISIVLIALACRSAIAGGVMPEVAFSLSDSFIQSVENTEDIRNVYALGRYAETEYCKLVAEVKEENLQNALVVKCNEFILKNSCKHISVADVAKALGVSYKYLSHMYKEKTGVALSEYINITKIAFAKEQLIYTDYSFEQIAYNYGYSSQSHFGQVFKKVTGMTPGKYREQYKK